MRLKFNLKIRKLDENISVKISDELHKFTTREQLKSCNSCGKIFFLLIRIEQSTVNFYMQFSTTSMKNLRNIKIKKAKKLRKGFSEVEHQYGAKYIFDKSILNCRYDRGYLIISGTSTQTFTK